MDVSVIIPTLNEASLLKRTLKRIHGHNPHEIIVADGGSTDGTLTIAEAYGARIVQSPQGKATQMNAGSDQASGELLWFLHADSMVELNGFQEMVQSVRQNGNVGGAFALKIDSKKKSLKLISRAATLRSKYFGLAYGDQGIFIRADIFKKIGGYAALPICEDLDLFRRMRKEGDVVILQDSAAVSPRRWLAEGIACVTLRNTLIAILFLLGFPPLWLSRWYGLIR